MSAAAAGWLLAGAATASAALLGAELDRRARRVAEACHEVRGPLTAARLGVHLAASGQAEVLPLTTVDRELARAAALLDDLQRAPRGGGPPAIRAGAIDLGALAREAAEGAAPRFAQAGAALEVVVPREPVRVPGDPARLAQALGNLLANAAEHGAGPVRLAVRLSGRGAQVSVEDHGPGLGAPLEALAARRSRARRGHGLAVAACVAAEHGGRLATAPSARGARLVLDLPAASPPAAASGERR